MRLHLLAAVALTAATASVAHADGLPVGNLDTTRTGVTVPGASERFFAIQAGRGTVVESVYRAGGLLQAHTTVPGAFTIPAVAQDGTTTGLSANAQTLVLVRPRLTYPQRRTRLAVLDAPSLHLRSTITLRGDFSVDAISPDGHSLYLIEYTTPGDPFAYAVRSLDLRSGRLDPGQIVDPRERDEAMHGLPISRAMSPDGRWAYTLYDGAGGGPFVHALDTKARAARCLDLPLLPGGVDIAGLSLVMRGGQLQVRSGIGPVAFIDRRTFAISRHDPAKRAAAAPNGPPSDGFPWGLGAAAAAAGAVALFVLRRRYAAGTDSETSRAASSSSPTVP
jgi:hypothetical protein